MKSLKYMALLAMSAYVSGEEMCTASGDGKCAGTKEEDKFKMPPVTRTAFGNPNPSDLLEYDGYHEGLMYLQREDYIVLFVEEDRKDTDLKVFREAAEKYKDKINFAWASLSHDEHKRKQMMENSERLGEEMGIKADEQPFLVGYKGMKRLSLRFTQDLNSLTVEKIGEYVTDLKEGRIAPYLKSEAVMDNIGQNMTTLVGLNYNPKVNDPTKDYFVMIYSNGCIYCKKLAPIWKKLANAFGDSEDTVIARLNIEKNDVEGLYIGEYPTLIAYKKDNKTEQRYFGDESLEALKKWVIGENMGIGQDAHDELMELDKKEQKENIGKDLQNNIQQEIDDYIAKGGVMDEEDEEEEAAVKMQGQQSLSTHDDSDL